MIKAAAWGIGILALAGVAAFGFAYSGAYSVAADDPHWEVTARVLATVRERSIKAHASGLTVPDLAAAALIARGAEHYASMCTGCHLAPGMGDNEMRQGLYPKPPDLTRQRDRSPAESFWIIKHGLKMSGMPAWGVTHDDDSIWGLVAFLRQLPTLDAAAYAVLTQAGDDEGHEHGDDAGHGAGVPSGATIGAAAKRGHTHSDPAGEEHDH